MMTSWIDASTQVICLFGNPVDHSLSPVMHNSAFKYLNLNFIYIAHQVEDIEIAIEAARNLRYCGFNITVPHKIDALKCVDVLDQTAKETGAINTGYWKVNKLHGTNTDTLGAIKLLKPFREEFRDKDILVVGAGGGARAIVSALVKIFPLVSINIANRTIEHIESLRKQFPHVKINAYPLTKIDDLVSKSFLVINTTSVGRKYDTSIISSSVLNSSQIVFDINYVPGNTKLINAAMKLGCQTLDGIDLLVAQGAESFKLWTGHDAPIEIMKKALEESIR